MDDQITEEEREAELSPERVPTLGEADPSANNCPKCGGDLTAKGECSKCKIYLCRFCGNIQPNDHSLTWPQTFGFFFVFIAVMALWLLVSIMLAGGLGVMASYFMYNMAQEKCSKCGKRAF
jgi:hypothetical protein